MCFDCFEFVSCCFFDDSWIIIRWNKTWKHHMFPCWPESGDFFFVRRPVAINAIGLDGIPVHRQGQPDTGVSSAEGFKGPEKNRDVIVFVPGKIVLIVQISLKFWVVVGLQIHYVNLQAWVNMSLVDHFCCKFKFKDRQTRNRKWSGHVIYSKSQVL